MRRVLFRTALVVADVLHVGSRCLRGSSGVVAGMALALIIDDLKRKASR